jgi:enterochelin esterase-like enzyme
MKARIIVAGLLSLPVLALATPEAKLPVPPSGWDAVSSVPHGEVKKNITYKTQSQGDQLYSIYLPPGYSTATKYPVLYLLHGHTDDQTTWTNNSKGRAHNIMDNLIAQKKAVPMVIVMPDGAMGSNSDFGAFGKLDAPLTKDLIPHIEATYSVSKEPIDRAIGGLSMGGGQTLRIGYGNPALFSWIGAFAAATDTDPRSTIKDLAAVKKNIRFSFLGVGANDGFASGTRTFHTYMDQNGIDPHMVQFEIGEGHSWTCFNRCLYNFAPRIFTASPTGIRLAVEGKYGKAPHTSLRFESGRLVVKREGATGNGAPARYFFDGKAFTRGGVSSIAEIPYLP